MTALYQNLMEPETTQGQRAMMCSLLHPALSLVVLTSLYAVQPLGVLSMSTKPSQEK